jgi:hypothetical protein
MRGAVGTATVQDHEIVPTSHRRHAKLDTAVVAEIRERYAKGNVSTGELAKYYSTTANNVLSIVSRRTWRDVP